MTELVEQVIAMEWQQFQRTHNEGGRAGCQNNWPEFHAMRASQFTCWDEPLLASWRDDLLRAQQHGRNLVTEKYARMMQSTDPQVYEEQIKPVLPELPAERIALQERIIAVQLRWAEEFTASYPKLGAAMRVLRSAQDTPAETSFETYLRGELSTYSMPTLRLYKRFIEQLERQGANLTGMIVAQTAQIKGFSSLDEAERAM